MANAKWTTCALAALLMVFLAPAQPARAASPAGTTATAPDSADEPAPVAVAVEIVREGGVAEAYRRDGADFPSYGPEGPAQALSAEEQVLRALQSAPMVQLASIAGAGEGRATAECVPGECIGGLAVLARAPMQTRERRGLANDVLGAWLRAPAAGEPGATPRFGHAISFAGGGHAWDVLLASDDGQYAILRDGARIAAGKAGQATGRPSFDAVLAQPR